MTGTVLLFILMTYLNINNIHQNPYSQVFFVILLTIVGTLESTKCLRGK